MKNPNGKPTNQDNAVKYRFQRLMLGLSASKLANMLGVDRRTVERRERAQILVTNESLLALDAIRCHLEEAAKGGWDE
jgi:predicted transcriptional regulator